MFVKSLRKLLQKSSWVRGHGRVHLVPVRTFRSGITRLSPTNLTSNRTLEDTWTLKVSLPERAEQQLSVATLAKGKSIFEENGFMILENVVDTDCLTSIRRRMIQDIPRNLNSPDVHYNHGKKTNNITQTPPLCPELFQEQVWANRLVISMMEHLFSAKPRLSYVTSNIALPGGEGRQAVHSDHNCSFAGNSSTIEVNIFLNDVTPENGATEVWLGTHKAYSKASHVFPRTGWIKKAALDHRATSNPPVQIPVSVGSVCLRDLRLWHAGMPNRTRTRTPRIMLGAIYSPAYLNCRMQLRLPYDTWNRVKRWKHIDTSQITPAEGDFDYLSYRQNLILGHLSCSDDLHPSLDHRFVEVGPEHYWTPPAPGKV